MADSPDFAALERDVHACRLCAKRFATTATHHQPKPLFWSHPAARLLIIGQAPGLKVYQSGRPFTDPSGERLRDWLGLDSTTFYDRERIAIVPMAFCFPGYNAKGSDLPPPAICARTWHARVLAAMPDVRLMLLIGSYSQKHYLPEAKKMSVNATVAAWRTHAPKLFPLPHPSWRNTAWIKRNPWFASELLPELRATVSRVLGR